MGLSARHIIGFLVLVALTVRGINWGTFAFGFDQIQILTQAKQILSGDLTLIGPRTGPAPLFTGPLIYYQTALVSLLVSSPLSLVAVKLINSIVVALSLLWVTKPLLSPSARTVLVGLWAISYYVVSFDVVPWNPHYLYLSGLLVFFPLLHLYTGSRVKNWHHLSICLGMMLGFQAHFSGLFLPFLFLPAWVRLRPRPVSLLLAALAGFSLSLLPVLLFDVRHQWLHLQGLLSLLQGNSQTAGFNIVTHAIGNIMISLENLGKLVVFGLPAPIPIIVGIFISLVSLISYYHTKALRPHLLFSWSWLGLIALFLTAYTKPSPEYYFFLQIPACLYILILTGKILPRSLAILSLILFSTINLWGLVNFTRSSHALQFREQYFLGQQIKNQALTNPIARIEYDMPYSQDWGLRHLLEDIQTSPQGQVVVISYPTNPTTHYDYHLLNSLGVRYLAP
jgi:hypothetical protein